MTMREHDAQGVYLAMLELNSLNLVWIWICGGGMHSAQLLDPEDTLTLSIFLKKY